ATIIAEFLKGIKKGEGKEEEIRGIIYLLQGRINPDYDKSDIGISDKLTIKAISKATGITEKEITEKWGKKGDLGEVAEELMNKKKQTTLLGEKKTEELRIGKLLESLRKLTEMEGKGTVEKKLVMITELFSLTKGVEAKYLVRTLIGDLRIGIASGIIRDAIVEATMEKNEDSEENKKIKAVVQRAYDLTTDFGIVYEKAMEGIERLEEITLMPGRPIKVMLYPKAKDVEDAFRIIGRPMACFPKGEVITVKPSIKKIEEINNGDLVIGKDGRYQEVIKTFVRQYKGDVIKITPHYFFPFTITPEHRVLTIKKELCSWENRKTGCRPNCQEQKYGCKKLYKNYKAIWAEANGLGKGDFILFPKFKELNENKKIDLINYNKEKEIEIVGDRIRTRKRIKGAFEGNFINRFMELSTDFFELMGWYLAEGDSWKSGVRFTLGHKEMKDAQRIKELMNKIFGIEAKISKTKNVILIKAYSVLFKDFFSKNFGDKAISKKIPEFIMTSRPELIRHFIRAYIKGDGHKDKNNIYTIVTASKNVAYQSALLLSKINILPSISENVNKGFGEIIFRISIYGKQINNIEPNTHRTKTSHQRFFDDDNYYYLPIRKVEIQKYSGKVYNLETKDNTYLTSGIVHNCEYKYDGFRVIISKYKGKINIYTRRLEEVSKQFPDVVEYAKKYVMAESFMIDAEVVGYDPKTKAYKPFQEISQRIKRKYDIEKTAKELPVEVEAFDLIYLEGKSLLKEPFLERRKLLEKIVKQKSYELKLAEQIITDDEKVVEEFYNKALELGEEGLMVKNLEAPYKPGARIGYAVKLKPEDEEFDLVITKAEWGTGKRGGWLTSYTVSCYDEEKEEFLEVGKVGSGLKEKEEEGLSFEELTNILKPLIIKEEGREVTVKPRIVGMINYQNIQKSPTYNSGYALRFPRIKRLRPDKKPEDINTIKEIEREYKKER
ncbi:hypothetical protein COU61_01745, partial [Candidatus Pacearchaeota archaeon CG10_big_fil_rev_8_21_14_0_10_35_13]